MDFATFDKIAKNTTPDDGVFARFYDRAVKTGEVSENGLPKFKTVCFCEIRIKDNNSEVYDQPAGDDKIKRFPTEYAHYQMSKKQADDGTPLEQFAFLSVAEIEALKLRGVYTVESLVEIPIDKVMELGIENEQALAIKFMEKAKDNSALLKWLEKEKKYLEKIKLLEQEIENLKMSKSKRKQK